VFAVALIVEVLVSVEPLHVPMQHFHLCKQFAEVLLDYLRSHWIVGGNEIKCHDFHKPVCGREADPAGVGCKCDEVLVAAFPRYGVDD
jgi:hypothetical protein